MTVQDHSRSTPAGPRASTPGLAVAAPAANDLDALCNFALDVLPTLRLPSGLYCFDRPFGPGPTPLRGESVRYSLMVWLGLHSASSAGRAIDEDLDALYRLCLHHRDLTAGDLGLLLWCDARRNHSTDDVSRDETEALVRRLDIATTDPSALDRLAGMEIGWMLLGLANQHGAHGLSEAGRSLVERILSHLRLRRASASALFTHHGDRQLRRNLPNFATEIYTVMALTAVARHELDPDARREAVRLADALIDMQRPDGGWPWLFDAERGAVVEPYEVYSVHQDAMAPMALLALGELTGDDRYEAAARRGLQWVYGDNELHAAFYVPEEHFAHRSIRRTGQRARLALWANSAGSLIGRRIVGDGGALELDTTCRPYHLGWVLEAWSSRASGPS